MFSRQTVLAVLAASAALISVDAFAPAARPVLSVSFTCLRQTLLVRRVITRPHQMCGSIIIRRNRVRRRGEREL